MRASLADLKWHDGRQMLWIEGIEAASVATSGGLTTVSIHLSPEEAQQVVDALAVLLTPPSTEESSKAWEQIADAYGGVAGR